MPRGNPRRPLTLRVLPELLDAVRATDVQVNRAVEEGLALWLARHKRQADKPAPLAKRVVPPTARKIAARKKPA
jgi:hypothetical protein